ncbi:hypothetical protein AB0K12_42755 [Nonomuraea sp. NPDC049419]|uniref:hypothetical protein n=1 Tax=Nonomuraea sp. NPDC049419 TaxID=3155772 RepID=UPI00342ED348
MPPQDDLRSLAHAKLVRHRVLAAQATLRRLLAEEETLDRDTTEHLLLDPSEEVRESLAAHTPFPDVLARLLTSQSALVRAGVAQNPRTTPEQRHTLTRDRSARVRATLLKFVDLDDEDLRLLAEDRSLNVRWWLATWPTTPREILELLLQDPNEEVSRQANVTLRHHRS